MDLHERFASELGDGPAHPPVEVRLRAGRAAVRRRRLAVGAMAAVVGAAGLTLALHDPSRATRDAQIATDPSPSTASTLPTIEAWYSDQLVRFEDGAWRVRPEAEVLERVDNPLLRRGRETSVGLALAYDDDEVWVLADRSLDGEGRFVESVSSFPARVALPDLESWLDTMVALETGQPTLRLVRFGDGETLEAVEGATILDQRPHPDLPASFAGPDDRTAVARVRYANRVWFVLARQTGDTPAEFIPAGASVVGRTIEEFLTYATQQYAGGEGLR